MGCAPEPEPSIGQQQPTTAPETTPPAVPGADPVLVTVHPQVATMLVVAWDQPVATDEAWVTWTVDGVEHGSRHVPVAAGPASALILGVPERTAVDGITVHTGDGTLDGGSATTGALPSNLFEPTVTHHEATIRPEPWVLTSVDVGPSPFFGPCYTVIVDADGRIVWYRPTEGARLTWQPRLSRAGDTILLDEEITYTGEDPDQAAVTRVTLDRAAEERTSLPGMITFDELDDGGFVYAVAENGFEFDLVRRHPDGTDQRIWTCYPWMEPYNDEYWGCATNTTTWDPTRGTVLWSTFETMIVLEIDLETGEIVREYGPYPGGYRIEPPESTFEKQHFPNWTAAGTLVVSTHDIGATRQLAREFEVDEGEGVLREIWSVETSDYAEYAGHVRVLPSGHLLWGLGTRGVIQEITREGDVLWRIEWRDHLVGNVTPIADLYTLVR